MKHKPIIPIALLFSILAWGSLSAQNLKGYKYVALSDSTKVIYLSASACPNCYYYLPTNLRVSQNESGQPETSLLKISETENDPITGGILHVLLVWGLDEKQEAEAQQKIRTEYDSLAVLIGAVNVENSPNVPNLSLIGEDAFSKALRSGAKNQSSAAVSPGTKMALSFRFDEEQVKTVLEDLEKKKSTDAQFAVDLNCAVPNSDGIGNRTVPIRLKFNFSKLYPYLN